MARAVKFGRFPGGCGFVTVLMTFIVLTSPPQCLWISLGKYRVYLWCSSPVAVFNLFSLSSLEIPSAVDTLLGTGLDAVCRLAMRGGSWQSLHRLGYPERQDWHMRQK